MAGFRQSIEASVPMLRRYARALARDAEIAEDLVQDMLVRALRSEPAVVPIADNDALDSG